MKIGTTRRAAPGVSTARRGPCAGGRDSSFGNCPEYAPADPWAPHLARLRSRRASQVSGAAKVPACDEASPATILPKVPPFPGRGGPEPRILDVSLRLTSRIAEYSYPAATGKTASALSELKTYVSAYVSK